MNRPVLIFGVVLTGLALACVTVWYQPWVSGLLTGIGVLALAAGLQDPEEAS